MGDELDYGNKLEAGRAIANPGGSRDDRNCPACGKAGMKVIYAGLPMKNCDSCSNLWGFWSWLPAIWFNGWLFPYEGSYLKALWEWVNLDGGGCE